MSAGASAIYFNVHVFWLKVLSPWKIDQPLRFTILGDIQKDFRGIKGRAMEMLYMYI